DYRAACRDQDVGPDREAYEIGRQDELKTYCTDTNGFTVGRANSVYHHVCPPDLEKSFLAGRARGQGLWGCQAQVYVLEKHLTSLEQALNIREQAIEAPAVTREERARLQREIGELEAIYRDAVQDLTVVERHCMQGRSD
ncbi:MAG: DUF2799 domain-containing protein, partial [Desulfosarcina sp.]|nr:DUF2799 domain-containing protein [Desulfobacterales bacterium]